MKAKKPEKQYSKLNIDRMLDEVRAEYHRMQEIDDSLRAEILDWNRDEQIQEANMRADYCRKHSLCNLSEKELKDLVTFRKRHYESCKNSSTYIFEIAETGIGHCIKVKCPLCGQEEDITDLDCW